MSSFTVDGRACAREILSNVAAGAAAFQTSRGRRPRLSIVRIGPDAAQDRYAAKKVTAGADVGIDVEIVRPHKLTMASASELLRTLNAAPELDAVFVQYPLPEGLDERALFDAIAVDKDVDCASALALGRLQVGGELAPANVAGLMALLKASGVPIAGRRAFISTPFVSISAPLTALLVRAGAFVAVLETPEDAATWVRAMGPGDLFVSCVGRPGYLDAGAIPDDVAVIDGTYFHPAGGDIRVADRGGDRFALWVPPRNALGPMTIACLMENTLKLALTRPATQPI